MKSNRVVVVVVVVAIATVLGVIIAYDVMGPTVAWSVWATAMVAIGATVAVTTVSHGSIEKDLLGIAELIRKDGEESRKTIVEAHRSLKEELRTKE